MPIEITPLPEPIPIPIEEKSLTTTFGARVKEIRENQGLTIAQCAASSGIDSAIWEGIENSACFPKLRLIWPMAMALGVRPKRLFV